MCRPSNSGCKVGESKPLFVPLKRQHFEAFQSGNKTTEYRINGPRWNAKTCRIGRAVTLSLGYGKQNRLHGKIVAFTVRRKSSREWIDCYGTPGVAACIQIELQNGTETMTKTTSQATAVVGIENLDPRELALSIALEPTNDTVDGWKAKAEKSASDSDLKSFVRFVLAECNPTNGITAGELSMAWSTPKAGGVLIWFGSTEVPKDGLPQLDSKDVLPMVRKIFGIAKPTKRAKHASELTRSPTAEYFNADIKSIVVVRNDRKTFDANKLKTLAADIKQRGIDQPLLVRELPDMQFELIAGERRFRAAKIAKLKTVPVRVKDADDEETDVARLQENEQREDLNAIERAVAIKNMIDTHGLTQGAVAKLLSCSQGQISNQLRLLKIPEALQAFVISGEISATNMRDSLPMLEQVPDRPGVAECVAKGLQELVKQWENSTYWAVTVESIGESILDSIGEFSGCRELITNDYDAKRVKFALTAPRREELDIVSLEFTKCGFEKHEFAFNVELFDKLQKLPEESKSKKSGASAGTTPAKKLTPAQARKEAAEKAKTAKHVLTKRIKTYRIDRLRKLCTKKLTDGLRDGEAARLVLHFAASTGFNSQRNALLASVIKKAKGRIKKNERGHATCDPLSSLASLPNDKMRQVTADFLIGCMEHEPEHWDSDIQPQTIETMAVLLKVDLSRWQVDEEFLQLHTIGQIQTLLEEWKRTSEASGKAALIADVLQMKQLSVPKSLLKATKANAK